MRHTGIWQTAVVSSLLAGCAALGSAELGVHDLKQQWQKYDGKSVVLRGQIDSCGTRDCLLCPENIASLDSFYSCITIAFGKQQDPEFWKSGLRLEQLKRQQFRFAIVTVRADFSAMCLWDDLGNPIGDVICTDSPANLDNAEVLAVRGRKGSQDGLVEKVELREIAPAAAGDSKAMEAEFFLVTGDWAHEPHKMLSVVPNAQDVRNKQSGDTHVIDGLACVCMEDFCDGRWPARYFPEFGAPTDPFRCWAMQKTTAGWRVLPSF
jgi:hypothetical protein